MKTVRDDETLLHERKRLRVEPPRRSETRVEHAPKMLPFVSPERPSGRRAVASTSIGLVAPRHYHDNSFIRTPLQVRAASRSAHSGVPSPVQSHMTMTRKKVRSSISAHKKDAMRQLERQYQALREKIVMEIGEAEEQFKVLQQANDSINEKTERKLKAMAELAATEITKIEKARTSAISATSQLYSKEKQKVLQRFDAEIDALTA